MIRTLALILSVVFQPLLVPTVVFAFVFYLIPEATSVPLQAKSTILYLIVLTTLVIPLISVIGMRLTKAIKSIHMQTIEDRVFPFSMVTLFYGLTTYFFYFRMDFDELIGYTLGLITLCILILTVITAFWKISAHTTGLAGLLAFVIVLHMKYNSDGLLYPLIFSILLCGAVMSSRLYLNTHKPAEVAGGFLLGFSICFIGYYIYLFN
ncbi:phosphatase PAP2 family protein [Litoribacter populi]|uniref:phosphatase PAP2 family protein n=1 Tax=Litoribacter populi TaxID=2598460 RepID=UPI00117C3CA4|nr:phosphatase PAP2 family protein [Litoribacter populi]